MFYLFGADTINYTDIVGRAFDLLLGFTGLASVGTLYPIK